MTDLELDRLHARRAALLAVCWGSAPGGAAPRATAATDAAGAERRRLNGLIVGELSRRTGPSHTPRGTRLWLTFDRLHYFEARPDGTPVHRMSGSGGMDFRSLGLRYGGAGRAANETAAG